MFAPEVRAGGGKTVLVFLFLLALIVIWIWGSSILTLILGALLLLVVLTVLYYVAVRFDRWARGGRRQVQAGGEN